VFVNVSPYSTPIPNSNPSRLNPLKSRSFSLNHKIFVSKYDRIVDENFFK